MSSVQPILEEPRAGLDKGQDGRRKPPASTLAVWLREPLLQFLLIGALLFVGYAIVHLNNGGTPSSKQINLTFDDLRQLDAYFESQWHRKPTPEEFAALVETKVQEEVLYREGMVMGLDKDDTIVKRRIAQKVHFLAEDVASAHEPKTAELKAWYETNSRRFALPSRTTFRHLYFSPDRRGQNAREDATKALARISGQPEDSRGAASLADPFMFQDYYGDRTAEQLAKDFGPEFAQAIFRLKPGSWQGPIESGYGWHLIFIHSFTPGRIPAFEEIEPDVKTAWLADQKERAWAKAYADMRAKYSVFLPGKPETLSSGDPAPPPKTEIPTSSGEGPQ
jgi:peptidyl-prolyl cis-trans isomerase C